jgi:hypothetical protein
MYRVFHIPPLFSILERNCVSSDICSYSVVESRRRRLAYRWKIFYSLIYPCRISAWTVFWHFSWFLSELWGIFWLLLLLGNDVIVPNSYQFIIHLPSTVCSRRQSRTINEKQVRYIIPCLNTGWRRTLNARCCYVPCSEK